MGAFRGDKGNLKEILVWTFSLKKPPNCRIIPFSMWLITMVKKSPEDPVSVINANRNPWLGGWLGGYCFYHWIWQCISQLFFMILPPWMQWCLITKTIKSAFSLRLYFFRITIQITKPLLPSVGTDGGFFCCGELALAMAWEANWASTHHRHWVTSSPISLQRHPSVAAPPTIRHSP